MSYHFVMVSGSTLIEMTAANVRAEAARAGCTQDDLAEVLDLSRSAISHRFTGRTPFGLGEIDLLSKFLDVPRSALVPDEDQSA